MVDSSKFALAAQRPASSAGPNVETQKFDPGAAARAPGGSSVEGRPADDEEIVLMLRS
jgi:hypothetical protein